MDIVMYIKDLSPAVLFWGTYILFIMKILKTGLGIQNLNTEEQKMKWVVID